MNLEPNETPTPATLAIMLVMLAVILGMLAIFHRIASL